MSAIALITACTSPRSGVFGRRPAKRASNQTASNPAPSVSVSVKSIPPIPSCILVQKGSLRKGSTMLLAMRLGPILRVLVPVLLAVLLARALVNHDGVGRFELVASGVIIAALLALALRGAFRRA